MLSHQALASRSKSGIDAMKNLNKVDDACTKMTAGAVVVWLGLVLSCFILLWDHRQPALEAERKAAGFTACALTASLVHRAIPFLFTANLSKRFGSDGKLVKTKKKHKSHRSPSGILWAAFAVNGIAASANWITFLVDVPILVDQMTGCRVHMMRWCAWAVIAFILTYMVEAIDSRNAWGSSTLAWAQGLSTACGLIFPLVSASVLSWWTTMVISFILFFALFPRYFERRAAANEAQAKVDAVVAAATADSKYCRTGIVRSGVSSTGRNATSRRYTGAPSLTVDEREDIERTFMAFSILRCCCIIWTVFVVTYCFFALEAWVFREKCVFAPSSHFVFDCILDLVSKLIFTSVVVDSHGDLINPAARSDSRVKELQSLIGVVWESSSDALVITSREIHTSPLCSRQSYLYNATSSPTVLAMLTENGKTPDFESRSDSKPTVKQIDDVIKSCFTDEEHEEQEPELSSFNFKFIDLGPGSSVRHVSIDSNSLNHSIESSGFYELICRAWALFDNNEGVVLNGQEAESLTLLQSICRLNGDIAFCEAKVTRLGPRRLVMVVRDVTERTHRHEAENRIVAESTARQMDAAANRFTRHEVKNGLLSAIGLCDSHLERHEQSKLQNPDPPQSINHLAAEDEPVTEWISELYETLTDTLNTVLSEAMARELVHDTYVSKPENVNVETLLGLSTSRFKSRFRFSFECLPSPLPMVLIEPHLLHCIHRNAISNACKYGEREGDVLTHVTLDVVAGMLTVQVINKPGVANDMLLALPPDEATSAVFTAGKRLHCDDLAAAVSSGDGGWIITKCAFSLGGEASISFEEERTIFTLSCPVHLASVKLSKKSISGACEWTVPPNVWGHGVDDSKVQRKILRKIFQMIGIPDERIVITGEHFAECANFARATEEHIKLHPEDVHLVIADENLDSQDDESVLAALERASGSCAIEALLESLKASGALGDQVLALVRSANDSGDDVALYRSRVHGFLPKEIIRRNDVLRVLEKLWLERFGQNENL